MSYELHQTGAGAFAVIDDKSGSRGLHLQPNARINTTFHGVITETSPGVLAGIGPDTGTGLPGGAIPVALRFFGALNSNTTSGTLSIGIDTTSTYFLNAANVANAPTGKGQQTPQGATNLFTALALLPVGSFHLLTAIYAETATSTFGGPWYVDIDYYVPIPA